MSPGVGFFYGGLARSKNIVNVLGMTLIVMGLMSVQWILWGYSLAFAPNADYYELIPTLVTGDPFTLGEKDTVYK
jgi:ammonia channel protein AmtB